jgi:hypothetical protein
MGQTLYTGPKGLCGDCGKPTVIRLGSMVGHVRDRSWTADPELVRVIYNDLYRSTMRLSGGKNGPEYIAKCLACVREPLFKKKARVAKLIWVAVDGGVGEDPSGMLMGPFCNQCFKVRRRKFESQAGTVDDLPIYYVAISHNVLDLVASTPDIGKTPEPEPSVQGAADNGVGGLF